LPLAIIFRAFGAAGIGFPRAFGAAGIGFPRLWRCGDRISAPLALLD